MLFHITHTHTWESCPYDDPESVRKTWGKLVPSVEEIGIKLIGAYVDAPAHTVYFIIETDSAEKIEQFLAPVLKVGHAEIRPVQDYIEIVSRKSAEETK